MSDECGQWTVERDLPHLGMALLPLSHLMSTAASDWYG